MWAAGESATRPPLCVWLGWQKLGCHRRSPCSLLLALATCSLERFAGVVGRERVIAGTDCGFGTYVGFGDVAVNAAWLKIKSLSEGAQIASSRLWP